MLDASACSSSRMTYLREPNSSAAPLCDSMSAICSGVVSRMSGGSSALARAARGRRVAGARLEPDGQAHLGDRRGEVARDVDGERLRAARHRACGGQLRRFGFGAGSARSTRLGRKPASVLPPPVGAISSVSRPCAAAVEQRELMGVRAASRGVRTSRRRLGQHALGEARRGSSRLSLARAPLALLSMLDCLTFLPSHQFCCNSSRSSDLWRARRCLCPRKGS